MDLNVYDTNKIRTKTIPQDIPTSIQYIIPGSLCRSEEHITSPTSFKTFLPTSIQDDTESFSCSGRIDPYISIFEAMAAGFVFSKSTSLVSTLLLDWADAKMSDQITRTVLYDYGDAQFKEMIMELVWKQKISQLEEQYLLVEKAAIRKFLLKNVHCIDSILEMHAELYDIFTNQVTSLSLIYDNDMEEDFEGLTIMVHTTLSIDDALNSLAIFDETYWLNQGFDVRRVLSVMVDPL